MDQIEPHPTRAALTYLKAIYDCSDGTGYVTTSQLAEHLSVAPASVTAMSQKLAGSNPPLVEYHKHHGVRLAPSGEQIALRIIRRHRLLEAFLVQALNYSWDEVHEEADLLENSISPRLEERLSRFTGNPAFDPHGAPIPAEDLSVPTLPVVPLERLEAGQKGIVRRVRSSDAGLLRYLTDLGVRLGASIDVISRVPYDGTMHVHVNQDVEPRALGSALTSVILVEKVE
jgi:DtxR family transcriptional regulator, Mn-dependent transcriptional regulator